MRRSLRFLLHVFNDLAFVAGVLLFVFATRTDDLFSWTIQPPLTAAFLGASYWAAAVLFWWTLQRDDPRRLGAMLVPVTVIAGLLLIATVIHWDRFHDDLFGWFWRIAYILVPVALAPVVLARMREKHRPSSSPAPLPRPLRVLLALQGGTMLAIGLALFVAPSGADALWPWQLTPLTARAIGAFVAGFGASALHAVAVNDLVRFGGAALAYSALGILELVAVARFTGDFTGGDLDSVVYLIFLLSVMSAGAYGVAAGPRVNGLSARH